MRDIQMMDSDLGELLGEGELQEDLEDPEVGGEQSQDLEEGCHLVSQCLTAVVHRWRIKSGNQEDEVLAQGVV